MSSINEIHNYLNEKESIGIIHAWYATPFNSKYAKGFTVTTTFKMWDRVLWPEIQQQCSIKLKMVSTYPFNMKVNLIDIVVREVE